MDHIEDVHLTSVDPISYEPLERNEIRLLDFDAPPRQPFLIHVNVCDPPPYRALSYCWGEDETLHEFAHNGHVLLVRRNLLDALTEFQRRGDAGRIWCDAVCIDQTNDDEKNIQIPMMGKIYSSATGVVAWLGAARDDELPDHETFKNLCALAAKESRQESRTILFFTDLNEKIGIGKADAFWLKLALMLSCEYPLRVWILQEVAFARHLKFWYGSMAIGSKDMHKGMWLLKTVRFWGHISLPRRVCFGLRAGIIAYTEIHKVRRRHHHDRTDVVKMLRYVRGRHCGRPADYIYGVHSLLSRDVQSSLIVDTNADEERVYTKATKTIMALVPGAWHRMLLMAESAHGSSTLPSWVPDFRASAYAAYPNFLDRVLRYKAGLPGTYAITSIEDVDDHAIKLRGHGLDCAYVISEVAPWSPSERSRVANAISLRHEHKVWQWLDSCHRMAVAVSETGSLTLRRTLVMDRPARYYGGMEASTLQSQDHMIGNHILDRSKPLERSEGEMRYLDSLTKLCTRRVFFTAESGRVGLGPATLRRGDKIILLNGAPTPWAFRPYGAPRTTYQLLGACYVDGVMDGEAMELHRSLGLEDQLYTLE